MTRVTLMHELSDRGPSWARLPVTWPQHPDAEHLGRRSLREVLADRRAARAAHRRGPGCLAAALLLAAPAQIRPEPWPQRHAGQRRASGRRSVRRGQRHRRTPQSGHRPRFRQHRGHRTLHQPSGSGAAGHGRSLWQTAPRTNRPHWRRGGQCGRPDADCGRSPKLPEVCRSMRGR